MSVLQPNRIVVPIQYWINLRKDGYQDWIFSLWRELFQNSIDARAKNVSISMTEGQLSPVFGDQVKNGPSIRIVFSDDGIGMSRSVIENVFLVPGLSTKAPELGDIGGFGTARTLLCFSQHRYEIHTRGLVVEGRGSEYIVSTADEAMERANSYGDEEFAERISTHKDRKGCVFIIEMDKNESPRPWENPDFNKLESKLKELFGKSRIKLDTVTYNGQPLFATLDKGRRKNRLATENGEEFASVYVNDGTRSSFNDRVLVRVNGLCMFSMNTRYVDCAQIIIEIDPKKALDVLTDNRESMKTMYFDKLWDFARSLSENRRNALRSRNNDRYILYRGSLGSMRSKVSTGSRLPELEFNSNLVQSEHTKQYSEGKSMPSVGASAAYHNEKNVIYGLHDFYMLLQADKNKDVVSSYRRHIPTYWRFSGQELAGRGRRSHEIFAAWSGAVQYALEVLASNYPVILKGKPNVEFVTGFVFVDDEVRGMMATLEDGRPAILLNPLRKDGSLAYDLNRLMDGDGKCGLQRLMMIAIHEVVHVLESSHNETYAAVLTDLQSLVDYREMARSILSHVNESRLLYGLGHVSWDSINALLGRSALHVTVSPPRESVPVKQVDPVSVDDCSVPRGGVVLPSQEENWVPVVSVDDTDLGLLPLEATIVPSGRDETHGSKVDVEENEKEREPLDMDMDLGSLRI